MVNLAGSRCFAKFRKNILTLTKARTSAQSVVKSVVIPNADDPARGPMHPASVEEGVAARSGDRLSAAMLWAFRHSGESWVMENPEG